MQRFDLHLIQRYISICRETNSIDFITDEIASHFEEHQFHLSRVGVDSQRQLLQQWIWNIALWWPKWRLNKYWFVSLKSHPKHGASAKEPSQLPERQVKEERRHRRFDYLKCAVQTEEINPDFDSYKSQTTLCEIVITMCLN